MQTTLDTAKMNPANGGIHHKAQNNISARVPMFKSALSVVMSMWLVSSTAKSPNTVLAHVGRRPGIESTRNTSRAITVDVGAGVDKLLRTVMCGFGIQRRLNEHDLEPKSHMSSNIVSSWKKCLGGRYYHQKTSIILMASATTTDLRIWNCGQKPSHRANATANNSIARPALALAECVFTLA